MPQCQKCGRTGAGCYTGLNEVECAPATLVKPALREWETPENQARCRATNSEIRSILAQNGICPDCGSGASGAHAFDCPGTAT